MVQILKMLEARFATQVVDRPADALQAHTPLQQRANHPEDDQVSEFVQPPHSRPSPRRLNARLDEIDAIPVAELVRCASGKTRSLFCGEPLHKCARTSALNAVGERAAG